MKWTTKTFLGAGLILALGPLGSAALADVTVTATIDKEKEKTVVENLDKDKFVRIFVFSSRTPEGAAEAETIVNVTNEGNTVDGVVDNDMDLEKDAVTRESVNENSGIVGVNQDVGNMVNQANVVSLAVTDSPSSFTESQAAVDQLNSGNTSTQRELLDLDDPDRTARIVDSVNDNNGIVGVNQNSGNMNNQTNGVSVAVGMGAEVALSEADLGQENTGNTVEELNTLKVDSISGSITGNSGIVGVNQSTGNMNNQASVVAFSAITSSANIGLPSP